MQPPKPTDTELAILKVLWGRGPSTVREVHETLVREQEVGYTTVLKMLQIMTEKGLVQRDTTDRAHVYEPAVEEALVERRLVMDLLDRAFGGSAEKLIMHALSSKGTPPEELARLKVLLDQMEKE